MTDKQAVERLSEIAQNRRRACEASARRGRVDIAERLADELEFATVSGITLLDLEAVLRLARSSEGTEPVAWTGSGSLANVRQGGEGCIWAGPAPAHPVALYLSPQPQGGGEGWTLPHLRMACEAMEEMSQLIHDEGSAELRDSHELEALDRARIAVAEALAAAPKAPVEGERLDAVYQACRGIAADYMTSEVHHPTHVLIPIAKFDQIMKAMGDDALSTPSPRVSVEDRMPQVIGALKAALAASDEDRAVWVQVALDFATNDEEALAEGAAFAQEGAE